jgi:hypothetical protein
MLRGKGKKMFPPSSLSVSSEFEIPSPGNWGGDSTWKRKFWLVYKEREGGGVQEFAGKREPKQGEDLPWDSLSSADLFSARTSEKPKKERKSKSCRLILFDCDLLKLFVQRKSVQQQQQQWQCEAREGDGRKKMKERKFDYGGKNIARSFSPSLPLPPSPSLQLLL